MNVLFVAQMFPWPLNGGTRQRLYHLLAELAKRHRVTLVAVGSPKLGPHDKPFPLTDRLAEVISIDPKSIVRTPPPEPAPWASVTQRIWWLLSSRSPNFVRYNHSATLLETLGRLRRRETFDAVWVERSYLAEMVAEAGFSRIVVDLDDLESTVLARRLSSSPWFTSKPIHYAELAKIHAYERLLPRRFWRLVVCKEADRQFFRGCHRRVFVVPNGAAAAAPAPTDCEQPCNLLFVGVMSYHPNVEAVRYFAREILPSVRKAHPGACFHIVGREPDATVQSLHDGDSCIVHGEVSDLSPFYQRASLVVTPINLGSGTRLKVLEALMQGKAVVATSIATEGLNLRAGIDLEMADDAAGFAAASNRLLGDPKRRKQLGASGRQRVLDHYEWQKIGEMAAKVLEN